MSQQRPTHRRSHFLEHPLKLPNINPHPVSPSCWDAPQCLTACSLLHCSHGNPNLFSLRRPCRSWWRALALFPAFTMPTSLILCLVSLSWIPAGYSSSCQLPSSLARWLLCCHLLTNILENCILEDWPQLTYTGIPQFPWWGTLVRDNFRHPESAVQGNFFACFVAIPGAGSVLLAPTSPVLLSEWRVLYRFLLDMWHS